MHNQVRKLTKLLVGLAIGIVAGQTALAHPAAGIVVDDDGQVYFCHGTVGIWKINTKGELSRHDGPGYHYLIEDPSGAFKSQRWPRFSDGVIEAVGSDPTLLAGSSFPFTIAPDGALYYPDVMDDEVVHIFRLEPSGKPIDFATLPLSMEVDMDGNPVEARWIHGLAAAPDGNLYYAEKEAVRRVDKDGKVTTVAENIQDPECLFPAFREDYRGGPILRNLDIAADGTVYVAAAGCCSLLRITPDGTVSVAHRSTGSWAPTAVAVKGDDLYVVEFLYLEVENPQEWLPRVVKVTPDGKATVLATVTEVPK